VQLQVRFEDGAALHRQLQAGLLDVTFTRPLVADPRFAQHRFEQHAQLLAIPANHPWARRRRIPWRLLDGAKVLLINPESNPNYGQLFLRTCAAHRVSPVVNYAADDLSALIWLVSAGLGVCPYPSSLAASAPPGIVFRPFIPAGPRLDLILRWANAKPAPLLSAFLDCFMTAS
jgi:DNA-binding transcriptional LysR family regulator